jgi:maltose-binding protein MalE
VWFWKKTWYRTAIVIPCSVDHRLHRALFWAGQRALGYG